MDIVYACYGKVGGHFTLSEHIQMLGVARTDILKWDVQDLKKVEIAASDAPYVYAWNFGGVRVPFDHTWSKGSMTFAPVGAYFLTYWNRQTRKLYVSRTSEQQDSSPLLRPHDSLSPIALAVGLKQLSLSDIVTSKLWDAPIANPISLSLEDTDGDACVVVKELKITITNTELRSVCALDAQLRNSVPVSLSNNVACIENASIILAPENRIIVSGLDRPVPSLIEVQIRKCVPAETPSFLKSVLSPFLVLQATLATKTIYYVFGVGELSSRSWIAISSLDVVVDDMLKWASKEVSHQMQSRGVCLTNAPIPEGLAVKSSQQTQKFASPVDAPVPDGFQLVQSVVTTIKTEPLSTSDPNPYLSTPNFIRTLTPSSSSVSIPDSVKGLVYDAPKPASIPVLDAKPRSIGIAKRRIEGRVSDNCNGTVSVPDSFDLRGLIHRSVSNVPISLQDLRRKIRATLDVDKLTLNQTLNLMVREDCLVREMRSGNPYFSIGAKWKPFPDVVHVSKNFRVSWPSPDLPLRVYYDYLFSSGLHPVEIKTTMSPVLPWGHSYQIVDAAKFVSQFGEVPDLSAGSPPGAYVITMKDGTTRNLVLSPPSQRFIGYLVDVAKQKAEKCSSVQTESPKMRTCTTTFMGKKVNGYGVDQSSAILHASARLVIELFIGSADSSNPGISFPY